MSGWVAGAVTVGAVVGAGASYLAAGEQADAAREAANTQADANRYAADTQYAMFLKQQELQKPWYDVGTWALPNLKKQYNQMPGALKLERFSGDVDLTQDPGYAFRLKEGLKTLDRTASARGGLLSGGALKAATAYGQEMGSQEYGNAYQRALTKYNTNTQRSIDEYNAAVARESTGYNRLASLAGIGQTTATNLSTQAGNYGTNVGNLYSASGTAQANALLAGGQARASAYQGIGSSIGQGVGAYLNYNQNQSLINSLNNSGYITNTPYTTTQPLGVTTPLG